jgi:hypothetical protein
VERFVDRGNSVFSFLDEVLVACPRCGGCALSRREAGDARWNVPRRLSCTRCAHVADWRGDSLAIDRQGGADPHFGLPLWLQAPCCGQTLWAYNAAHLDFLAAFVGATLRGRQRDAQGWANASLASRLPTWMRLGRHRAKVLRGVAQLRERLP